MKTLLQPSNLAEIFLNSRPQLVVYCEGAGDAALLRFLLRTALLSKCDIHVLSRARGSHEDELTMQVIPSVSRRGGFQVPFDETRTAEAILAKSGPGRVHELLARYSKRIGADLVIVPIPPNRNRLWSSSIAERLARYIPVLAVPIESALEGDGFSSRPFRWLVPLEGSMVAETILGPLSSLTTWLPSEVTLIQPLDLASLWSDRVVGDHFSTSSSLSPSIWESNEYLLRCARHRFNNAQVRICCTTGSDALSSILHLADSSTFDAVAIGLSNRWRISRYLTAELNELVLRSVRKPVLLFEPGAG